MKPTINHRLGESASALFIRIYRSFRRISPTARPISHYESRIKSKKADRRFRLHLVR